LHRNNRAAKREINKTLKSEFPVSRFEEEAKLSHDDLFTSEPEQKPAEEEASH
jgi:hypothetical protein